MSAMELNGIVDLLQSVAILACAITMLVHNRDHR